MITVMILRSTVAALALTASAGSVVVDEAALGRIGLEFPAFARDSYLRQAAPGPLPSTRVSSSCRMAGATTPAAQLELARNVERGRRAVSLRI